MDTKTFTITLPFAVDNGGGSLEPIDEEAIAVALEEFFGIPREEISVGASEPQL